MFRPIIVPLASALFAAALLAPGAYGQDNPCRRGTSPGGGVVMVEFGRGQSSLNERARQEVAAMARRAANPKTKNLLCVEAYTDGSLDKAKDVELARARAEAAISEFVLNGTPRDKIVMDRIADPQRLGPHQLRSLVVIEIRYFR